MNAKKQDIHFVMDDGFKQLPVYQDETLDKVKRSQIALNQYAQTILETVTHYAVDQGYPEDAITFAGSSLRIVTINAPQSLNEEILAMPQDKKKEFFANVETVLPDEPLNRKIKADLLKL